jgi:hypothetical protein
VRHGASWTAAYHLQLTVAAVAGPVLVVLAAELSWLVAQAAAARRSVQPGIQRSCVVAVVSEARTPVMASVAGRCPPCGVHSAVRLSGSGGPAVQCLAVWCPACPARPVSGRLVSTRPASSRLLSAPSVRTRPSRPTSGSGVGDQVEAAGNLHHRNVSRSGGLPRRGAARSTAEQAHGAATPPRSRVGQRGQCRTRAGL